MLAPAQTSDLALSTATLAFAPQPAGSTSALALPVVLTNTGTSALKLTGITASAGFTVSEDCGSSLAVNAHCTAQVSFTPTTAGATAGTLTVADDIDAGPQTVGLSGDALPAATVSGLATLHAFSGGAADGSATGQGSGGAGLLMDASGNLYGTTVGGGANNEGTVFEMVKSDGVYSEKLLYSFGGNNSDGAGPNSGLLMDPAGNLYGTTMRGGIPDDGTVFELVNASGSYSETILWTFSGGTSDGATPAGGLVVDGAGNFYGATAAGGVKGLGTVYELAARSGSMHLWVETVLYSFLGGGGTQLDSSSTPDGQGPVGGLALDGAGNLYGMTSAGGACELTLTGCGVLFELSHNSNDSYSERVVESFGYLTGSPLPIGTGAPVMDAAGDIFGATTGNGYGGGTVFEMKGGALTVLYSFSGVYPAGPLTVDSNGDVFGVALNNGSGIVFELANNSGNYTEAVLYAFDGTGSDGRNPGGGLAMDTAGDVFGITTTGGSDSKGTVFEFGILAAINGLDTSTPPTVDFGDVVATTTNPRSLSLTAVGGSDLNLGTLAIAGANAADFALQADTCSGRTLAPGMSCSVAVAFTPAAIGAATATLTLPTAEAILPTIALAGAGVSAAIATLTPSNLNFSATVTGTTATEPVVLSDTGTAPLVLGAITLTGADYSQTNNCPVTLAAGASCAITVSFKPSFAGPESATLDFSDDATGSPQSVPITGAGTVGPAAQALTILHAFIGRPDGANPRAGLLRDTAGNLFGTTESGGANGDGSVFELVNASGSYTEKLLYSFTGGADGSQPSSRLVMDSAGDIFGISTAAPKAQVSGTVFELVDADGSYAERVLHSFPFYSPPGSISGGTPPPGSMLASPAASIPDGSGPTGGLTIDAAGDLFGATATGGAGPDCNGGCGTVFELVNSAGSFTEKILYSFAGPSLTSSDGFAPGGGLILDSAGDLYGTTFGGGEPCKVPGEFSENCGYGTVFELVNSAGAYTEKILYGFADLADGNSPNGDLAVDAGGNLFGTTTSGISMAGTAFELVFSSGLYTETTLYQSLDLTPTGGLIMDSSGNLYGVGRSSGNDHGGIFILARDASGSYAGSTLFSFDSSPANSYSPWGNLATDAVGNLYGVTFTGGTAGQGFVYEFTLHAATPLASLSASSVGFGATPIGATAAPQPVTVSNTGNAVLNFTTIAASGDFSIVAGESTTCATAASLAAGASCAVSVAFAPTAAGTRTGTLAFDDNAAGSPQTVALSGSGTSAAAVGLAPASLTFAAQVLQSSSSTQAATLVNTGNAPLAITSVTASGDFTETNTCGTGLAANDSCTISVSFTPTATGSRTGTLTVTDNASGSPQTVALSGQGADLTVAPGSGSSTSSTVAAGKSTSFALNFTPVNGLTGTFTLACSGAPTGATCTPTPASISLSGSAPVPVTVAVTTTARSLLTPLANPAGDPPAPAGREWEWGLALLALWLLSLVIRQGRAPRRARRWMITASALALFGLMAACGGGGASSSGGPSNNNQPSPTGTPAGSYTLTVTATGSGGATRSTALNLTVN